MLADLLIAQGRLPEAQQVIDLLKEEEYFNYIRRDRNEAAGLGGRATLTPAEARLENEYVQAYLKRLAQELGGARKAGELVEKIQASEELQDTLRELGPGVVALHTVVSEDRYSVILTTADGPRRGEKSRGRSASARLPTL
jgi:hypothetical protein